MKNRIKSRKKTEAFILNYIGKITHNNENNLKIYKEMFKRLSDKEFDKFMHTIADDKNCLQIFVPNGGDVKIDTKNNFNIGKELGVKFFHHLTYKYPEGSDEVNHTTDITFAVLELPVRRVSQVMEKSMYAGETTASRNVYTGQVTGASSASNMTLPEAQLLVGMGLEKTLKEIMKYRGGDQGGERALNASLDKYGEAKHELLDDYSTGVVSTATLHSYLNAMRLTNNL